MGLSLGSLTAVIGQPLWPIAQHIPSSPPQCSVSSSQYGQLDESTQNMALIIKSLQLQVFGQLGERPCALRNLLSRK